MFRKFKNTNFKKLLSTVALVYFLLAVLVFVCWMNLISYVTTRNFIKTKMYLFFMYHEILIYWVLLAHFFLTLSSLRQFFFSVFIFNFIKPKLFYQYLYEILRKEQLRGILLNTYVLNMVNVTKLCSLSATFFKTQQTFNVERCC